jgi:hypothetical protein
MTNKQELYQEWRRWFREKFKQCPEYVVINKEEFVDLNFHTDDIDEFFIKHTAKDLRDLIDLLLCQRKIYKADIFNIITFEEWLFWINTRQVLFEKYFNK